MIAQCFLTYMCRSRDKSYTSKRRTVRTAVFCLKSLESELPATASQKDQDGANSLPCLASIFVFIQIVHKEKKFPDKHIKLIFSIPSTGRFSVYPVYPELIFKILSGQNLYCMHVMRSDNDFFYF
ncbi:hypothetical protein RIR_jg707.t1 [Rhizophagus irregularis DAOM 181602=DAOM 197198]|nr:hypothetical protein RIR_jg707.t1 [Rhizophagus irregularis DAOM 181602=DAOM 197198]